MTKFKLTIEADVELGAEESAEYASISEEKRKEYVQAVIGGMTAVIEDEMPPDMKRTINVSYEEVSE